jgi:hypothetical protein
VATACSSNPATSLSPDGGGSNHRGSVGLQDRKFAELSQSSRYSRGTDSIRVDSDQCQRNIGPPDELLKPVGRINAGLRNAVGVGDDDAFETTLGIATSSMVAMKSSIAASWIKSTGSFRGWPDAGSRADSSAIDPPPRDYDEKRYRHEA